MMILLRARANDADGVYVRLEALKFVSPVFDGILDSWTIDAVDGEDLRADSSRVPKRARVETDQDKGDAQTAARPGIVDQQPTSKDADAVNIITLECTPEELNSFVKCISMTASGDRDDVILGPAGLNALLAHGACAMRCLVKYDASGVLRTLDLMANCVITDFQYRQSILNYFVARVALLPDDAPADAISEPMMAFITDRTLETIRSAAPAPSDRYLRRDLGRARVAILSATARFPRSIAIEILTRIFASMRD